MSEGFTMDIQAILAQLPHRYPFLMVDRIINIRGDANDTAFTAAVKIATGCDLPLVANTVASAGDVRILWLGPNEWWVVGTDARRAGTELLDRPQQARGDEAASQQRHRDQQHANRCDRQHRLQQRRPQRSQRRHHAVGESLRADRRCLDRTEIGGVVETVLLCRSAGARRGRDAARADIVIDQIVAHPDHRMTNLPVLQ